MGQIYQGFEGANIQDEILADTDLGELGVAPVCLAPGEVGAEHSHDLVEEVMIVKAGQGQIEIEDQCHEVCAGSVAVVGAGEFHAIHNTGDENLEMVIVFNSNVDLSAIQLKTRDEHFGTAAGGLHGADRAALRELQSAAASMNALLEEVRDELAALRKESPPKRRARAGKAA